MSHGSWSKCISSALLATLLIAPEALRAQSTEVSTEYLMTLYAPLDAPQEIDGTLFVYTLPPGRAGWVKGPAISGNVIPPAADWLRIMPSGNARLDVRLTIRTDDGALVYVSYNGVVSHSKESWERLLKGDILTGKDHYFVIAPTMQTASEKYAWLNHVQCIGKVVEVKAGEGSYVKYDIFAVR